MTHRPRTIAARPMPRRRGAAPVRPRALARPAALGPEWTFLVRLVAAAATSALLALLAASPAAAQSAGRAGARSGVADVARASTSARLAAPDPSLTADDVVAIVLDALAQNDRPTRDRGIEVTFGFASPANRAVLGTADRLADLVREEMYRPLLYHGGAVRAPARIVGARATQRVLVTSATGERVAYTFTLTRQVDGPFQGCWMTDGVTREPPSALRPPSYAAAGAGGARAG